MHRHNLKNIALFIPNLNGGGAQRAAINLAEGLLSLGCEVDLVVVKTGGPLTDDVYDRVNLINLNCSRTLFSVPKLTRHLNLNNYDALMAFMNYANITVALASLLSVSQHVLCLSEQNMLSQNLSDQNTLDRLLRYKLTHFAYKRADHVTATSEGVATDLKKATGISHVDVVPNPITLGKGKVLRGKREKPHHAFLTGDPVILGAGSLT